MKTSPLNFLFAASLALLAAAAAPSARAQMNRGSSQMPSAATVGTDSQQTELHSLTDIQRQNPGVDRKEIADYKKFYDENAEPAKKIELGKAFLQKYPKSTLDEAVDVGLVNAYIARQDWPDLYTTADSALALKPDDIDVLTTVGWVIPHVYRPEDPDADSLLGKAETYEKHALEVIPSMPKPARISDAQFASLKAEKSVQAHSALGLVYFRRSDYGNSARELHEATQGNANADQADLYVLGIDEQNLKHYADAADAYARCAQSPGSLQDQCKQGAETAKKLAQLK